MKQDIKEKWVAALRSDEYVQGEKRLVTIVGKSGGQPLLEHCCLGVLTDLYAKEQGVPFTDVAPYGNAHLTAPVCTWAGLDKVCPTVLSNGDDKYLSDLNDSGRSFRDIASLIEEQL